MQSDQIQTRVPENFKALQEELQRHPKTEDKLVVIVTFLESTLAQAGSPHFKDFWEAKKLCLELFKEHINPSARLHLWSRYSELAKEARRLKEIFDEETKYAVEQIEMAIKACEEEVSALSSFLEKIPSFHFSHAVHDLLPHHADYMQQQRELNLLNTFATKVTQLRKELQRTDMRVRDKNKFFDRLSLLGDAVFPRRKELINQVSALFLQDIDHFIQKSFAREMHTNALLNLKDEIKVLQSAAKELTLNTDAFQETRKRLSECWDSIQKQIETERKKVTLEREEFRAARDEIVGTVDALLKKFEEKTISEKEALNQLDGVQNKMKSLSLGRHEAQFLKDKIFAARDVFTMKERQALENARDAIHHAAEQKEKELDTLYKRVEELFRGAEALASDALHTEIETLTKLVEKAAFTRAKKLELEDLLMRLQDLVFERREKEMAGSKAQDVLCKLLEERKKRGKEIKARLEALRKSKGSSRFDFAQALKTDELIEEEKQKLLENEQAIEALEERLE